jgi:hypothetical protein
MLSEWPTSRERELYFYRELYRLQKLKKDKEAIIELLENKNNKPENLNKEKKSNEDEQWNLNEKILLDTFKKEEEFINEVTK